MPADRPIALLGFMASGKSTIGRHLAQKLELPFTDTDDEIERAFGMSIPDVFTKHGEADFRRVERETIRRLLSGAPQVISLGGGACQDEATRTALTDQSTTIWLDPPFDLILARLSRSTRRPLAQGRSPADLRRLWGERRQGYSIADVHIVTNDDDPSVSADRIAEMLG